MNHQTNGEQDDGLIKEESQYIRFEWLLEKAKNEGRLDGQFQCPTCGMKYHYRDEAENCCKIF